MSEKKRKEQRQQHEEQHEQEEAEEEQDQSHPGETEHDLIEYDPEKAQDMIDVEEAAEHANQVSSPQPDDPQHQKQGVPRRQENVSSGFTTGRGMQGGSANRRKR